MHVTECVFLRRIPIADTEYVYELWSREFGKIRVFVKEKKTESRPDAWALLQANVETKGNKNRLVSFKLRRNVSSENMGYDDMVDFLKSVAAVSKSLPEGVPHPKLFDAYRDSVPFFESGSSRKAAAVFLTKLARSLGTYAIPEDASDTLRKFETAVISYDVPVLHSIRGIDESLIEEAFAVAETAIARQIA